MNEELNFLIEDKYFTVDWYDLVKYLVKKLEIDHLDIFSLNGSYYKIDATFENPYSMSESEIEYRKEVIYNILRHNSINNYNLKNLVEAAVEREWLPKGKYIISVSW